MNANDFKDMRGVDLFLLSQMVDAVTLESPRLIFENRSWQSFVHALSSQIGYRRGRADLAVRNALREHVSLTRQEVAMLDQALDDYWVGVSHDLEVAAEVEPTYDSLIDKLVAHGLIERMPAS